MASGDPTKTRERIGTDAPCALMQIASKTCQFTQFVVIALLVTESKSSWLDGLAIILLIARVAQSVLHIGPTQTELIAGARFGFYAVQIACMIIMGSWAAAVALADPR